MLIADLNTNSCAVIRAGREGLLPPVGERERLEALLQSRLATFVPDVDSARAPRVAIRRLAIAVGFGLIGGALLLRTTLTQPDPPVLLTSSAPKAPPETAQAAVAVPHVDSETSKHPDPQSLVFAARVKPLPVVGATDRLGEEVALLSRATSDLRAGRPARALTLLDEYQRKFPNGVLQIERTAARAQALCALKRVSEGQAELAALAPKSPAAGRAQQVCDKAASVEAK